MVSSAFTIISGIISQANILFIFCRAEILFRQWAASNWKIMLKTKLGIDFHETTADGKFL